MSKKTREQIITDMCYTWRHDYGIDKHQAGDFDDAIESGTTAQEREHLWRAMSKLYDQCFAAKDESDQPVSEQSLVFRLRKRAEIRRQIPGRKSVQEGKSDRIADLLDEAADYIETLLDKDNGTHR